MTAGTLTGHFVTVGILTGHRACRCTERVCSCLTVGILTVPVGVWTCSLLDRCRHTGYGVPVGSKTVSGQVGHYFPGILTVTVGVRNGSLVDVGVILAGHLVPVDVQNVRSGHLTCMSPDSFSGGWRRDCQS